MNKGVKQVRKSIAQRKNLRSLNSEKETRKKLTPAFPQEEEKHGYYPIFPDNPQKQQRPVKQQNRLVSSIVLKGVLSVIMFFGVAFLYQTDATFLSKPMTWTSNALTKEFPFARVNQWYQETFGSPMALAPKEKQKVSNKQALALPVNGKVSESFQANGSGIMISPQDKADVVSLDKGVVIFAGNDRETDKTVVVQHADGSKSTYGYLDSIDVHLYQSVAYNQRIGEFVPNETNKTVFFAIEKDNKYVDPVQVIKVDDVP
ncbi:peptidoglycan DD-metalloendopeptidase family protein [Virgibacillus sp. FSP13]